MLPFEGMRTLLTHASIAPHKIIPYGNHLTNGFLLATRARNGEVVLVVDRVLGALLRQPGRLTLRLTVGYRCTALGGPDRNQVQV